MPQQCTLLQSWFDAFDDAHFNKKPQNKLISCFDFAFPLCDVNVQLCESI